MWYVIDKPKLEKMLNDFAAIIGLPISFFSKKRTMVLSFNKQQEFCKRIQGVPENLAKCWDCDWRSVYETEKRGSPYIYICHAGLNEVVIPVKVENVVMSYVMFGQFISGGVMDEKWEQISNQLNLGNLDKNELKKQFMKLKHFPNNDAIHSYIRLFSDCLEHFVSEGHISRHYPTKLQEAVEYIHSNVHKPINVSTLASNLNISTVYLNNLMNKEMGIPPGRYIMLEKMKKATQLLSNQEMSVTAVAYSIGIQDLGYFSRMFKKNYGVSPTEFRKQRTNGASDLEF